jgi:hypothetical protein
MLRAQSRQWYKVVLSLLAVCQQHGRPDTMHRLVLPALGAKDLGADALVLPVLQSLYAAGSGDAAAVAGRLLSGLVPSAKALSAMLAYLQVRLA